MRRTRIISGIVAFMMATTPFAGVKSGKTVSEKEATGGVKTVTVSEGGDCRTMEAARDFVRTLDKSKYTGIEVTVSAGEYRITEPIVFTAEDSGTASCPIIYKGEDGATIVGGITLTASDFSKSAGALTAYFPQDVRDSIVSVDLKDYGFTADILAKAMEKHNYLTTVPFLSADGERQILAQYPNDWLHIEEVVTHSEDGTAATAIDLETLQTVTYGEEHAAFVQSWSEVLPVFVRARFTNLWCPDDSKVVGISKDSDKIDILFGGGYGYELGTIMYFYNVPEALDMPGEYIIDKDAVLYYYPTDSFESATFTVPLSDGIVDLTGADYLTFDNLVFTSSRENGLDLEGNHLTLVNCTVSSILETAVNIKGDGELIRNCVITNTGNGGIRAHTGDVATMSGEGLVITENDISANSLTSAYGYAVDASGANITVSHNDIHDSNFKAVHFEDSVNCLAEYNEVWNMMLLCDDVGAMSADGYKNCNIVFRYNYVHDLGPVGEAAKIRDYNPDYKYYGADAFYYDNGCSYIETYGNVVRNCSTGYLSNGGRGNSCHNNIFMDCNQYSVWFSAFVYYGALDSDGNLLDRSTYFDNYVHSNLWKSKNADLDSLTVTTAGVDAHDEKLWLAPVGCECFDNLVVFDKANRYDKSLGIKAYYIEPAANEFSPNLNERQLNDRSSESFITYSSNRSSLDLDKVIEENAEKYLGISYEQFQTVGRTEN